MDQLMMMELTYHVGQSHVSPDEWLSLYQH